ncbi:MAG: hypothetical protein GY765_43230, partial [bacterium]|nr:hypothetical protein [bacterium]
GMIYAPVKRGAGNEKNDIDKDDIEKNGIEKNDIEKNSTPHCKQYVFELYFIVRV